MFLELESFDIGTLIRTAPRFEATAIAAGTFDVLEH